MLSYLKSDIYFAPKPSFSSDKARFAMIQRLFMSSSLHNLDFRAKVLRQIADIQGSFPLDDFGARCLTIFTLTKIGRLFYLILSH